MIYIPEDGPQHDEAESRHGYHSKDLGINERSRKRGCIVYIKCELKNWRTIVFPDQNPLMSCFQSSKSCFHLLLEMHLEIFLDTVAADDQEFVCQDLGSNTKLLRAHTAIMMKWQRR